MATATAQITDLSEDELDTTPTTASTTANPTNAAAAAANDDDQDVDFGQEDLMADDRLPKLAPGKDETIRVNLLTDLFAMRKSWSHFVPNKGSFRCLSERDKKTGRIIKPAICCVKAEAITDEKTRKGAVAKLLMGALAVQYANADKKDGLYHKDATTGAIPAIKPRIGWVKLSRYAYREITAMINGEETEKVTDFDIKIGPDTKGGVGFSYNRLMSKHGSRVRHPNEAAAFAEVKELAAPFLDGKELMGNLGKRVNAIEMAALWAGVSASTAATANLDNVEDVI